MEKDLIEKAMAYSNMVGGLVLAKTICRRKILEANPISKGEQHLILDILGQIEALIQHAEKEVTKLGSHSG